MAACNTCTPLKDEFRPSTSWIAVELPAIWHHKGNSCFPLLVSYCFELTISLNLGLTYTQQ